MTFNNIVSGDRVFIGSREDINHLLPETIQLQTRATPGIVDIGIELGETVCSQHHTVWEDPRGSRRRFERIQRVGVQDMCSRVELILKKHQNLYVPINTILTNCR